MADGCGEVGFAYSCGTDEDEVAGFLEPVGGQKLHDLVAGDFRIESPVEIAQELDALDAGGSHQVLDSLCLPELILFTQESF